MNFLNPNFLWGLFLVGVPILVHLFNFRKFQKVTFTHVHFLQEIHLQSSSKQKLKHRLILLARILTIIALVLAFAHPYIPEKSKTEGVQNIVSIFIDNSPSMDNWSNEGTLLSDAKRSAIEIASAYSLNDKFQLLTNDFEHQNQQLMNFDELLDAVKTIKISSNAHSLKTIIERQKAIFYTNEHSNKYIYVISDFQKGFVGNEKIDIGEQYRIRFVQLKGNNVSNIAIDSIAFLSPIHQPNGNESLVLKVCNYSDQDAENIPLKLIIDNEAKAVASISIPSRSFKIDTFNFSRLNAGWKEGCIQIADNPITFDNIFYFSFEVKKENPVVIIQGKGASKYIQAVYETDNFFQVKEFNESNILFHKITLANLVVLNELQNIPSGLASQLQKYIENGGRILFVPSFKADLGSYQDFLTKVSAHYPEKIIQEEAKIQTINLSEAIFQKVFEQSPKNAEFPHTKRYFDLSAESNVVSHNLLTFENQKPCLNSYKHKKGIIYISTIPFSDETTNFPKHAIFVPMLYRMTLDASKETPLYYSIENTNSLLFNSIKTNGEQTLRIKKQNLEFIPSIRKNAFDSYLELADQIKTSGNYYLNLADSTLAILAFNPNIKESDLSFFTTSKVNQFFLNNTPKWIVSNDTSLKDKVIIADQPSALWKLFLCLSLLFITTEIILIKYFEKIFNTKKQNTPL